jgi:hypothetical protein
MRALPQTEHSPSVIPARSVIPAEAGIRGSRKLWIPAFAGMT